MDLLAFDLFLVYSIEAICYLIFYALFVLCLPTAASFLAIVGGLTTYDWFVFSLFFQIASQEQRLLPCNFLVCRICIRHVIFSAGICIRLFPSGFFVWRTDDPRALYCPAVSPCDFFPLPAPSLAVLSFCFYQSLQFWILRRLCLERLFWCRLAVFYGVSFFRYTFPALALFLLAVTSGWK